MIQHGKTRPNDTEGFDHCTAPRSCTSGRAWAVNRKETRTYAIHAPFAVEETPKERRTVLSEGHDNDDPRSKLWQSCGKQVLLPFVCHLFVFVSLELARTVAHAPYLHSKDLQCFMHALSTSDACRCLTIVSLNLWNTVKHIGGCSQQAKLTFGKRQPRSFQLRTPKVPL